MNIYRPCVCLVLRKLHNICSQTLTIACSDAKKQQHTYTISTVGKTQGFWLEIWPSVTPNTSLCWRTEPLHHHASALQGEEGRASVDHWEMWGSQHHLAAARSKPERRRPRLRGRRRMGHVRADRRCWGSVTPLYWHTYRSGRRVGGAVWRNAVSHVNQGLQLTRQTVGNRSICVTLKGCVSHTHAWKTVSSFIANYDGHLQHAGCHCNTIWMSTH